MSFSSTIRANADATLSSPLPAPAAATNRKSVFFRSPTSFFRSAFSPPLPPAAFSTVSRDPPMQITPALAAGSFRAGAEAPADANHPRLRQGEVHGLRLLLGLELVDGRVPLLVHLQLHRDLRVVLQLRGERLDQLGGDGRVALDDDQH